MPATTGSRRKAFRSSSNFDNEPIQFANSVGKCHVAILGSPFHGVLEIQQHHHCGRESHFHATPVFVPGEHVPMTGADGRFPRREPRRAAGRPPVSKKRSRDLVKCRVHVLAPYSTARSGFTTAFHSMPSPRDVVLNTIRQIPCWP